ncbi:MAG: sulfatase [Candidatus Eisenbacteria sp.]|nr:sulfatase [Candidatus Eisenbacteria bacterium]
MRNRTAILGSLWVGLVSGALCGLALSVLFSPRLFVAYLFSILVYSAAGGMGALALSAILVLVANPHRALRIVAGLVSGSYVFFALAYWGNRWLLVGNPFTSSSSLKFDAAALAVAILIGVLVAVLFGRWLGARYGPRHRLPRDGSGSTRGERERPVGRMVAAGTGVLVVLPLVLLLVISVRGMSDLSDSKARKPSVILISIDALRADHLGCYGYPRKTTPVADRLAAEGVRFEYAFCPVPSTGPSHATMLTGLTPSTHGLRRNGDSLPDSALTLAEVLSEAGYATGGFTTNIVLDDQFGFTQGFDTYVESGHVEKLRPITWSLLAQTLAAKEIFDKFLAQTGRGRDLTILSARKWLAGNAERPFFLFLHLLDPHHPYEPLEPYRSRFSRDLEGPGNSLWIEQGRDPEALAMQLALYDGEIAAADAKVGDLLQYLEDAGIMDGTLIVFTADHGENMGDHELFFRHTDVYDASMRVPLIIRFPGVLRAGRTLTQVVENSALFPTILSLIHHDVPAGLDGEDLALLMEGTAAERFRFALANSGRRWALRTGSWKIRIDFGDGSRRLYDLVNDPEETTDVLADHPEVGEELETILLAEIERLEGALPSGEEEASPFEGLDRETIERLKALGYVQ